MSVHTDPAGATADASRSGSVSRFLDGLDLAELDALAGQALLDLGGDAAAEEARVRLLDRIDAARQRLAARTVAALLES